jgi:hypothetical protein
MPALPSLLPWPRSSMLTTSAHPLHSPTSSTVAPSTQTPGSTKNSRATSLGTERPASRRSQALAMARLRCSRAVRCSAHDPLEWTLVMTGRCGYKRPCPCPLRHFSKWPGREDGVAGARQIMAWTGRRHVLGSRESATWATADTSPTTTRTRRCHGPGCPSGNARFWLICL